MTLRIVLTTTTLPSVIFLKYEHLNLDLDYQPLLSSMPGIISQTQLTQRQMVKTASQPPRDQDGEVVQQSQKGSGRAPVAWDIWTSFEVCRGNIFGEGGIGRWGFKTF